jgi:hypothetical protein
MLKDAASADDILATLEIRGILQSGNTSWGP